MLNRIMRRKMKASNVETPPKPMRSIPEIQSEYKEACAALGDRSYRVAVLKAEIAAINNRLAELNKEADAVPKQQEVQSEQAK